MLTKKRFDNSPTDRTPWLWRIMSSARFTTTSLRETARGVTAAPRRARPTISRTNSCATNSNDGACRSSSEIPVAPASGAYPVDTVQAWACRKPLLGRYGQSRVTTELKQRVDGEEGSRNRADVSTWEGPLPAVRGAPDRLGTTWTSSPRECTPGRPGEARQLRVTANASRHVACTHSVLRREKAPGLRKSPAGRTPGCRTARRWRSCPSGSMR